METAIINDQQRNDSLRTKLKINSLNQINKKQKTKNNF